MPAQKLPVVQGGGPMASKAEVARVGLRPLIPSILDFVYSVGSHYRVSNERKPDLCLRKIILVADKSKQ